jgi:two-component system, cell cycle sensor histidine kinase and response regulator CckA
MKTLDVLSSEAPTGAEAGVTVLVVDDEHAVRRFAVRTLEREGFMVVEAKDGAEALDAVRAGSTSFHLVVSDIVMPRLNGVELMQALASSHPDLPVILMSGYATAALHELGISAPCSILVKPFPPEQLLFEVRRCLKLNPS